MSDFHPTPSLYRRHFGETECVSAAQAKDLFFLSNHDLNTLDYQRGSTYETAGSCQFFNARQVLQLSILKYGSPEILEEKHRRLQLGPSTPRRKLEKHRHSSTAGARRNNSKIHAASSAVLETQNGDKADVTMKEKKDEDAVLAEEYRRLVSQYGSVDQLVSDAMSWRVHVNISSHPTSDRDGYGPSPRFRRVTPSHK